MIRSRSAGWLSLASRALIVVGLVGSAATAFADNKPGAVDSQIETYLLSDKGQETIGKAMEGYVKRKQEEARKKQEEMMAAQLEDQFKNPVAIELGASPSKGPAGAKITIIEFSDFQCPFCKRGKDTAEEVMKAYPNDVKLVFKHLPLPMHPEAMPAAKASLAAHKQGKFWEMHDALFENQGGLGADFYTAQAAKLGLNVEKFKTDMADPKLEELVKADMAIAEKHEIRGTPGFFVNGVAVRGAYPVDHFKKIIDRLLSKAPAAAKG